MALSGLQTKLSFIEKTIALHISPSRTPATYLAIVGYFPGYTNSTTPIVAVMTVDYVRIYLRSHDLVAGPVSVNAGGDSEGSFFADTNFLGGRAVSTEATIDTSLIR